MQSAPSDSPVEGHISVRPAWTAYADAVLTSVVILLVGGSLVGVFASLRPDGASPVPVFLAALALITLSGGLLLYRVALIGSRELYTDDSGVHYQSGLLPWARGVVWVKWRDIDTATCTLGFRSWLLNSYRIRVGHRFTLDTEIVMSDVPRGRQVVGQINALHQRYIARTTAAGVDSRSTFAQPALGEDGRTSQGTPEK